MSGLTVDQICDAFPEGTAGNKIQIGYGTSGFRARYKAAAIIPSDGTLMNIIIHACMMID